MPEVKAVGTRLMVNGQPRFLLGANYWSRRANIQMWRDWDLSSVVEDLDKAREIGLNSLRIFLLARDFSDEEGRARREALEKLRLFFDEAAKRGILLFPSLIVGHMSGKNWPLPWDPNDEVYTSRAIERASRFIAEVVKEFKDHPALGGWILSNEITHVRRPPSLEEFRTWLGALKRLIHEIDGKHPVSVGDSTCLVAKPELKPENVRDLVDYFSPHLYLYDFDPVRHTLAYAANLEYCRSLGKPVVLEEFGYPTALYSEESHAQFIEVVLFCALGLGASGAFVWCLSDFPREGDEPYLWEPHELTFGLLKADGSEKLAAKVVRRFSKVLKLLEVDDFRAPKRETAILVPSHFYKYYPFHNLPRDDEAKAMVEAYALAKAASLPVTFVREEELDGSRFKLLIAPSITRLLTVTWRKLLRLVERGLVLYYSNCRHLTWPHMSSSHLWEELFGVKPALLAGLFGVALPDVIKLEFTRDLPPVSAGSVFTVNCYRKDVGAQEFVSIDAEVAARYDGKDALFIARRGEGSAYLLALPYELLLASTPAVDMTKGYHFLYSHLARIAGISPTFAASDPRVQVEYLVGDAHYLVVAVNHSFKELEVELKTPSGVKMAKVEGAKVSGSRLLLKPKSGAALLFERK